MELKVSNVIKYVGLNIGENVYKMMHKTSRMIPFDRMMQPLKWVLRVNFSFSVSIIASVKNKVTKNMCYCECEIT